MVECEEILLCIDSRSPLFGGKLRGNDGDKAGIAVMLGALG